MINKKWTAFLARRGEIEQGQEQLQKIQASLEQTHLKLCQGQQELDTIVERSIDSQSGLIAKNIVREKIDQNIYFAIDSAFIIPDHGVFLEGWLVAPNSTIRSIVLKDAQGMTIPIKDTLSSKKRPDVYEYFLKNQVSLPNNEVGFFGLIYSKTNNFSFPLSLVIELDNNNSQSFPCNLAQLNYENLDKIKRLLSLMEAGSFTGEKQLNNHLGPTVYGIWKNRLVKSNPTPAKLFDYGNQPKQPEISIVVPLYGRIDFLQYQLSLFADDPDFQKNQLIYILDDPRLENELFELCSQLAPLFEIPFKVIYTGQNFGYAKANNVAVDHAIGKYLVLLNSDVMPKQNRWLTTLITFYKSSEKIGAIGPTLLYEDESIQHAGMSPCKIPPYYHLWFNDHPGKGQPNFRVSDVPYRVPALTGACLMVSRELYITCGGLSEDYILGDFEDSDFCLKILQKGYKNYCLPTVELYHLERQSQSLLGEPSWRQSLTLYNSWLYTQRWDTFLQEILSDGRGKFNYD